MFFIIQQWLRPGLNPTNQERARERKDNKNCVKTYKINPQGTRGPIWPKSSALFLSPSWLHYGAKNFVDILDHHQPGDQYRRSQTTEEALSKAN